MEKNQYLYLSFFFSVGRRRHSIGFFEYIGKPVAVAVAVFVGDIHYGFICLQQAAGGHVQFGFSNKILCGNTQNLAETFVQITL